MRPMRMTPFLSLVVLALLLPHAAKADEVQNTTRYRVTMVGADQLKIQMPIYDEDGYDGWVHNGYVYVTPAGGNKLTLLHYNSKEKSGPNATVWFNKGVDGRMVLSRDGDYEDVEVTTTEKNCQVSSATNVFMTYFTWTVPENLRGKELTISWKVRKTGSGPDGPAGESGADVTPTPSKFTFPEMYTPIKPTLMEHMLGYDAQHAGQMMIIYTMASDSITSLTAHYTEVNGKMETKKSKFVTPEMSGFIYLDADKCYKDFTLEARYRSDKKERISYSDSITIPTLHQPYALTSSLQADGSVQLTWNCRNNNWDDIVTNDTWEIQRNTTGSLNAMSQWQPIGQVTFGNRSTTYSFTDNSLMDGYEGQTVYYRVRRTSTAIWDWVSGTYAQTSLPYTLRLPALFSASVSKGKWTENSHTANFTFRLGGNKYDSQNRFLLRDKEDWETFANMVDNGNENLNAIMVADIVLDKYSAMIGEHLATPRGYAGTFDGNGHTLTIMYDTLDAEYVAPFTRVGSATIKNLHVAGKVVGMRKFAAGLVGNALSGSNLTIMNCRVSALVGSTIAGDASNGGFIAYVHSDATLRNCLFDGQLVGEKSHSTGGFVGVGGTVKMENCLFSPLYVKVDDTMTSCNTFSRAPNNTFTNCYYTIPLDGSQTMTIDGKSYYVLRNSADWKSFLTKIVEANGNSDVNAILANDFDVVNAAGYTKDIPFRGVFEGNGHTLNMNIKGGDKSYIALFVKTKDATIRNLNVTGSVSGGPYTAGLVGSVQSSLSIENCRVSAHIYTTQIFAGGFIGHSHSSTNAIRNSLFDGIIEAKAFVADSYAGAFRGMGDEKSVNTTTNCLENGRYINFDHVAMCFLNTRTAYPSSANRSNYSLSGWDDTAVDASKMGLDKLLENLGSYWTGWGTSAIPSQMVIAIGQGIAAYETEPEVLVTLLNQSNGAGHWKLAGNLPMPVQEVSASNEHVTSVWDEKAKLVLLTDKSVNGNVRYTDRRELSSKETEAGQLNDYELLTPCVDYDFRLVVEQGGSKLMPIDTTSFKVTKTEKGENEHYEFNSNVKLVGIEATTQQSSVSLEWETTGMGDFFRILRRDKAEDDWEELESAYNMTTYIDKTTKAQHVYVYKVIGVNDCEGVHTDSVTVEGWCEPTGMVRGYVRLPDGTALANVPVVANPQDAKNGITKSTVTTENGFFEIGGLTYVGAGSYEIVATAAGDESPYSKFIANFDEDKNLVTNAVLIQNTYYQFQGYVMYEGTSVPVIGAQFERDGLVVKNGSGTPVITDSQGRFSVSIPQGEHSIRVVKDGHVFMDEGFYLDENNNRKANWQKGVAEYVFWDKTTVTLQGRVVGGDVQGLKPLGELASINNLGDSVTIVMQLEGDNASYLVRDQLNASITERHNDYDFAILQKDTCHMDVYRHRLVIKPSPVTGEYCVPMLPVKYKVTEIYGEGYPTLFQAGKVGETLDLSDYANKDTATYSRIYHAMPTLNVSQFNMLGEQYMGIKSYTDRDNTGKEVSIELWNAEKGYSFGYPVYMEGSPILMQLAAVEKYYKNNNPQLSAPDIVQLPGGEVRIQNALVGTNESETVKLDSLGEAIYRFTPQNLTFTQEDDIALKTLTMTLEYDNTHYDVLPMNGGPIRGFVMASRAKSQGRRVVAEGPAVLVDILRDPPGAGSSAYIESGSKLSYSFTEDLKVKLGLNLTIGNSTGEAKIWTGVWGGVGAGNVNGSLQSVKATDYANFSLVTTYYNNWQYSYTFETTERISTSSKNTHVGRDADLFIGMVQNVIAEDGIAVRAIDEATYNLLTTRAGGTYTIDGYDFKVPQGTMKLLAEGKDSKGKKVYLVRDEVLMARTELENTFVHSQTYIENELIPDLFNQRNTLILPKGTDIETAREVAKEKDRAMYISHVDIDDDNFGMETYYTKVDPDTQKAYSDEVHTYNSSIRTWVSFLATNEKEKLLATDHVKSYEVDGRATVSYSEKFGVNENESRYWQFPLVGTGFGTVNFAQGKIGGGTSDGDVVKVEERDTEGNPYVLEFDELGEGLYLKCTPVLTFDYNYNFGKTTGSTKSIGFTLQPSGKSNLVVDVYRAMMDKNELNARVESLQKMGIDNTENLFFQYVSDEYYGFIRRGGSDVGDDYGIAGTLDGVCSYVKNTPTQYRSFVYRTRGGATAEPYEDERKTKYYNPGIVLDAKTMEIDHPRIWVEQASVSNVPADEPARFTLHFVNESSLPALSTTTNPFLIFLSPSSNPKGAKVYVDGFPLAGEGLNILLNPNEVVTKTVEVYPSKDYDYEDIQLGIKDPLDVKRWWNCNISAHFVPVAGKVNISLPGDKWVVNTESAYDSNRQQYYMPVRIDGFDVNFRNFDHIELQYKLTTQGEKDWVNVCSFYSDSLLFSRATGERQMMVDEGRIMATFWGENDPIEQTYDLRAVNFCRYGDGFLTRASDILTGVKDTRRPQLFGMPKPEDGIVGVGDDILLRFSEPIAGNYLRGLNNFQVLGQTNSNNISLSTDLRFNGEGGAQSMNSRNLAGKSFTVEMMISPDRTDGNMTLFSHGDEEQFLELGITADWQLAAVFKDEVMVSEPIDFNGLRQVTFVVEADVEAMVTRVSFYDGTHHLGTFEHQGLYGGTGAYALGVNLHDNEKWDGDNYRGEMLEFRLWNQALSLGEMSEYGQKRLTGYELGLMDNFPLNEGQGVYSYNRVASGGDLSLEATAAAWKVPDGIGLKLDGGRGFRIEPQKFSRTNYQDYTLMFWFRTTDEEGTLLSNGQARTEADAQNHFNFGVRGGELLLRLGGRELATHTRVNNGGWHHVALTVSRSRNVGNLYVDKALKKTFAVDTLGGIMGSHLAAGATYLSNEEVERPISGHIDEICMYEMALTENILKSTASMTPTGEELGMMAYLNFGRNELQQNNQQQLVPTGVSLKRYRDLTTGELTTQRDTLVAQEVVERLADKNNYAPMRGLATLENIPYSFVADGKDLLINLDLPDYQIEKTNVMVTVKDVADLNGNTMASPVTLDLHIYRNPLRWTAKQLNMSIAYGEEHSFEATVQNLSGRSKRFTIQGLPVWMTASQYEGVVDALGEQVITFTVSPSINMGDFDETIYLAGEDGMSEPLPLNIKVRGEKPDWAVDDLLHKENNSMSIIGRVEINDNVAHDGDDMLAAFNSEHRLLGVAHVDASATGANNEGLFYLNVYNMDLTPIDLFFEFFDASTGTIHQVMPAMDGLTFKKDTVIGTSTDPVIFFTNNGVVQTIPLKKGWNWVSFNVNPQESTVKGILGNATKWEVGDGLEIEKTDGEHLLITYKSITDPYNRTKVLNLWDYGDREIELEPTLMYRFFSNSDKLAYVSGNIAELVSITVKKGWNRIGYISRLNLPIGTAMADYTDKASAGDIIKSQSEFAVLSVDASGNKNWKGTLKYLRVGEGYMLKRNADDETTFFYPDYYFSSRYDGGHEAPKRAPAFENNSGTSMTVVAEAIGIDVLPGDRLTAYRDGEVCGVSDADEEGVFYLNVGDTHHASTVAPQFTFTIERDDELLGVTTRSAISYTPDAAYGTPDAPTAISFVNADNLDADDWYDLSGRKVGNDRMKNDGLHRGVYIHNNQKVMIK